MTARFVFLDRDGVLNRRPPPHEYVSGPDALSILPGAVAGVLDLHARGYEILVATNQKGVALGLVSPASLEAIHAKLREEVRPAVIREILVCPHDEAAGCACRKPRPGLLLDAAARYGIDLAKAFFVGDLPSDVRAGRAAGTRTILVGTVPADPGCAPEFRAADLREAAGIILREDGAAA